MGVLGNDETIARTTLGEMISSFERRGLLVLEVQVTSGTLETKIDVAVWAREGYLGRDP